MKKFLIITTILLSTLVFFSCKNNNDLNNQSNIENTDEITKENNKNLNETPVDVNDETNRFKGYMWSVEKNDHKVYLFGSVHIADDNLYPFDSTVESAFSSSDYLVVEADPTDMSQLVAMSEKMIYTGSDTVFNHLSEGGILKYEQVCQSLNIKPKMLEKIKIWALGSNLMSLQLIQGGFEADSGVDMYFLNKAKKLNKEILELEGAMFQLNLLDSFSDEVQEEMFISSLGTVEETIEEFKVLYENYLTGDVELMTEYLMSEEISSNEEVEKAMLDDRNIGMFKKIETYLETENQYFVVVGLAHLLGDKSLVKLLESKGYNVTPLN